MTLHLTLISHAATAATRGAVFGGDGPLLDGSLADGKSAWPARRVLCGPSQACHATAAALSLQATPDPALADQDWGRWQGLSLAEVAATEPEALPRWLSDPEFAGHGGESRVALVDRAAGWLAGIREDGRHTLAITHPALIRALVLHVLAAPAAAFWQIDIAPATATGLSHDGRRWALRSLGCPLAGGAKDRHP